MENGLLNRFLLSCQAYSQSVFLIEGESNQTYTYGQFLKDVQNTSFYFKDRFPEKNIFVLLGKNSYQYAVYLMGALMAGKKIFPINPDESETLIVSFLTNLKDTVQVFAEFPEDYSAFTSEKIVEIKTEFSNKADASQKEVIVFMPTSATTGQSKIVIQNEKAILANVDDLIEHHQLKLKKTILTPLPLFHVNALHFSFFCTLFTGGTLILLKSFEPRYCLELIQKYKVRIVSVIPTLLANLAKNISHPEFYDLSSLDYFVSAAAPLSVETVKQIKTFFGKKIIQGYGLSETINFSCLIPIDITDELYSRVMCAEKFPSIGIALKQNEVKVVDDSFQPVLEGVEGNIVIKGANLMNGYMNTEMSAYFNGSDFITGDIGFYKKFDGQTFYFISGRKKETAKVHGETVSLRELDEQVHDLKICSNDCFTICFANDFKGEELAIVCKAHKEEVEELKVLFLQALPLLKPNRRPKVVLFVTSQEIRTPSGKAKRSLFKGELVEFKGKRLVGITKFKVI